MNADAVRALTVSSWYPAVDDTTKGRFVADQVAALRSTGSVEPLVLSFEPARLTGGSMDRHQQAAAVRHGVDVALAERPDVFSSSGWSCPEDVPVARLPIPSGNRRLAPPTHRAEDRRHALVSLVPRLRSSRPTVVHAHTGYPDGVAAAGLAEALGVPLVITEHATFLGQQLAQPAIRDAYAVGARRAARYIAVSRALADEAVAALPELSGKVVVIPNAVAIDEFRPGSLESRHADELLYVGYRTETKGIDVLLSAFARVRAARPTATLRLIGRSPSDEFEERWHRLARELGVADVVSFEGPSLRSGVAAAMQAASVLVHASRRETFGVAPVEALAAGLPVVATDTAPLREILGADPTVLGALAPIDDPEAFAQAVIGVLERRGTFDPVTLRLAVETRFGGVAVAQRIADLYATVLSEADVAVRPAAAIQTPGTTVGSVPAARSTLVVGFDTASLGPLLATLPAGLRSELSVVCSGGATEPALPADLADVMPLDVQAIEDEVSRLAPAVGPQGGPVRRILRLLRSPLTPIRRRSVRGRRDRLYATAVDRAVRRVAGVAGTDGAVELACLDGLDYLAASSTLAAGRAVLAPGGIRWLADRSLGQATTRPTGSASGTASTSGDA